MRKIVWLIIFVILSFESFANNISISNVNICNQDIVNHCTFIEFDISWENSWRVATGPSNWDASWVFIKYRLKNSTIWNHASLNWVDGTGSGDGHTVPANAAISSSNDDGMGHSKGIFIYGNTEFPQGSVSYTGVKLRWNYGFDGVSDTDSIEYCVMAIEMVYVPQGSFYVGDGTSISIRGQFESGTSGAALQITSEGALTLGGGGAGSLGNNNALGMAVGYKDDFNDVDSQTLPADFPKGYNAFYCMKYEITQEQYVVFLNKLDRTQQNVRTNTNLSSGTTSVTNRYVMSNSATIISRNGVRCDASIHSSDPISFYCDYNGNDIANESDDGQNISCNWVNWADLAAYLDWAALRPMTELEYEKACRGTLSAVANEYAWGSSSIAKATGISNSGANNETASNVGANAASDNHASVQGPMRAGNFGQGVSTRVGVGATFYGIMEMSGNNWERAISVGNTKGREFTGTHGNGELNATGNADVSNWPGSDAIGANSRGGYWRAPASYLRVSDRYYGSFGLNIHHNSDGSRGVRIAP
ncbi:MAG: SUMF1/EgtB/PvdO family nonheme iron enzyme [Bacteroidales bacterium]|nr:SUMF1/EgtB/PvdO family nonheme iron enzyme [Bacteroidales bacterium]